MVAAAAIGASAISAGVGAYSSNAASDAKKKAVEQGIAAEQSQFNTTRNDLMPYQNLGLSALPQLQGLTSGNPSTVASTLQALPGYQWDLNQGLQAAQNSAAARGLGSSGAALGGAASYATGLADNTFNSQYNRLLGLAGIGQGAASQTGQFGAALAAQIAAGDQTIGNIQAQQDLSLGSSAQSFANLLGSGAGLFT